MIVNSFLQNYHCSWRVVRDCGGEFFVNPPMTCSTASCLVASSMARCSVEIRMTGWFGELNCAYRAKPVATWTLGVSNNILYILSSGLRRFRVIVKINYITRLTVKWIRLYRALIHRSLAGDTVVKWCYGCCCWLAAPQTHIELSGHGDDWRRLNFWHIAAATIDCQTVYSYNDIQMDDGGGGGAKGGFTRGSVRFWGTYPVTKSESIDDRPTDRVLENRAEKWSSEDRVEC